MRRTTALWLGLLAVLPLTLRGGTAGRFPFETFSSPRSFYDSWKIKKWRGTVEVNFLQEAGMDFVKLTCASSSWAFVHKADAVDLSRMPVLAWSWKALALAKGGDGRRNETDDQTAAVYVFFPGTGLTARWDSRIVGYTWETKPPKGTFYTSPKNEKTKVFVLRNETDPLDSWQSESRNVAEDFKKAFGLNEVPRPQAVCFQIDSDDTRSRAESALGPLDFEPAP